MAITKIIPLPDSKFSIGGRSGGVLPFSDKRFVESIRKANIIKNKTKEIKDRI